MLFDVSRVSVPPMSNFPSVIDTNRFCQEDFHMFLECSNFIEQSRTMKRKSKTSSMAAQKLYEELFEVDYNRDPPEIIIDENFDLNNLSLSMKNLFQYFNEDIEVLSGRESMESSRCENEIDIHRPVIVGVSPKVPPTVKYKPSYMRQTKDKSGNLNRNRKDAARNSLPSYLFESETATYGLRRQHSLEIPLNVDVEDKEVTSDLNSRGCPASTISVKDRIAYFNKLTDDTKLKKQEEEAPKPIDIFIENPVSTIKSQLYESLKKKAKSALTEELILPAEPVRCQIEKFERGQIRSPFQSRSSSEDTIKKDSASSLEELASPKLVKDVQQFIKVQSDDFELEQPETDFYNPQHRCQSSSPDSLGSDSTTLEPSSPLPASSPSDYYSSSDSPLSNQQPYFSYNTPSPENNTPEDLNFEVNIRHPFIESGENLKRLQDIVDTIRDIRAQGFIDVSQDLFEQFLMMLCMCADICLVEGIKSCEGNLDEIRDFLQPPENELQKSHDSSAALSEHQLRVQASLQRLNIPDWFRQYNSTPKTETGYKLSNFNRKRASESGRWTGLNSKTTSLSSLGSQRSDRSPLMLSPSAHSHHGGQTGFSRWSTSHLNSTQTSPSVSTRGSFSRGAVVNSSFISGHSVGGVSIRNSFRQPYLGWRSQEKLALSQPRTPHERLASSVLAQQPHQQSQNEQETIHQRKQSHQEPPVTPEIQSSIKEVTSAIVHYVNDQTNRTSSRSRSTSPSSRKCWVESSFVGIKPVESPQTPVIDNSFNANAQTGTGGSALGASLTSSTHSGTSDVLRMNGVVSADFASPTAASLEDVLASLLGLPSDSYRSTGDTVNDFASGNNRMTSNSPNNLQVDQQNRFRRRSEGDAQKQQQQQQQQKPKLENSQPNQNSTNVNQNNDMLPLHSPRRVSLDSSESKTTSDLLVRCRNTKCDQMAPAAEAKRTYKSCHNCSHQYCSRECRRAHWEKHRKACLHSRVSNLCRQVLASCKDDTDTLRHLSLLARKGYLSQGRGVVRILFRSPESAEAFIKNGFQCLGEASYVRWPDLMPAEMGLELYSELLRLSTEYKPDSKMLIYVAICVVSEAPGTATAPVKWERQLVSRCAKLKLCKTILTEVDPAMHHSAPSHESLTEILILTFNTQKKSLPKDREIVSVNIQTLLSRRGVVMRKHYPEIYQRLQNYVEGITDKFSPVTIHPRDSQTGQGFVCIIMPNTGEMELNRLPKSDTGNRVTTVDVGEELFES